jgi:hypothetical protein
MIRLLALATALAAAACGGSTGTLKISLVTATGSHVLDAVEKIRLTITEPHQVIEATRTSQGFDLSVEFDSNSNAGTAIVEGFDASGALVACGQSPAFPLSAVDAAIVVYVAAPNSIALAPVTLTTPRSEIAGTPLSFGAVLAGGRTADGIPTTDIGVYNAYDHSFAVGAPMPAARTGLAMTTANNLALMFGGTGTDGNPTGTLWEFDTSVAPNGAYSTLADQDGFKRAGQLMLTVSNVGFPITGEPPLLFDGTNLTQVTATASLPAVGGGGFNGAAVFVGDSIIQFANGAYTTLGPGRASTAATTRSDGHVIVAGGGDPLSRDVLDINPDTGAITTVTSALSVGRKSPSIAATSRHVVVIGGTDDAGDVIASADVLDATTLTLVITVPALVRTGTYAIGLPTDQVLIAGGAPASGDLELFTPLPPTTP